MKAVPFQNCKKSEVGNDGRTNRLNQQKLYENDFLFSCRPVRQALAVNNGVLLLVLLVRLPQDALFWALNWIKLVQNGSNLSKLEHTCPKWIKLVQT